jgi:nitrite reductase/ring-hydroxylating ferredoxin subunit
VLPTSGRDFVYGREGQILRCSRHGWEFEIATGRALADPRVRARTYPVTVENGHVIVTV